MLDMKKIILLLFLPLLMASACKKEPASSVLADSVGGNEEPYLDSLCLYAMGDYG